MLALLVLAMFAGVVWLAYTQGVARGRTETPVLTAQNGPARIAPQNPGGAEQPYKGFKIYEQPAPPDEDVDTVTTAANGPRLLRRPQLAQAGGRCARAPCCGAQGVAAASCGGTQARGGENCRTLCPQELPPWPPQTCQPVPVAAKPAAVPAIVKKELPPPPSAPVGLATAAPRSLAPVPAKPAPPSAPAVAAGGSVLADRRL